ncbi:hypothetical protein [Thiorhodovibrio frisius]|uniref:hypothetical protein n=1 Tax=Thiorhodovibrio frisius TaxID=631362 RepID=UPI00022C6D9C|nr:hypothetical protein [Thiorhodovibrio frisius]WPL24642.1 hypothetical protein Thiofri_04862 [Thiorhodovibrio frisius]
MDYRDQLEALLEETNPFALVTVAHLLTQQTRGDQAGRYAAKWRLTRLLYERDCTKARQTAMWNPPIRSRVCSGQQHAPHRRG